MLSSYRKHEPHQLTCASYLLPAAATNQLLILILCLPFLLSSIKQNSVHCHQSSAEEAGHRGGGAGEAPDFEEPIGNFSVAVGKDVQLPCKIARLAGFRSAWLRVEDRGVLTIHTNIITPNYRIGLRVEDEGRNFMLTIKNVQPSDRGAYMCQINTVPMRSMVGHLNVLTPPVFEEAAGPGPNWQAAASNQPQAQPLVPDAPQSLVTSQEKGNVSLSCRASGNPAPTISWRREDNEPILVDGATGGGGGGQPKVEGPTLLLSQVSRLSAGAYLCIASNGVLPSPSRRLTLEVQFAPVIRLPQTEVGAQLGREARLLCYVEWNPAGSYHWVRVPARAGPNSGAPTEEQEEDDASLLESSELVSGDKFELASRQMNSEKVQLVLVVRRVEKKDLGWYRCIARNSLGAQSSSVRLHESSSGSTSSGWSALAGGGGSGAGRLELAGPAPAEQQKGKRLRSRLEPSSAAGPQERSASGPRTPAPSSSRMLLLAGAGLLLSRLTRPRTLLN